jgi:hypothetical protein
MTSSPPGGRQGSHTLCPRPKATAECLAGPAVHDPADMIAPRLTKRKPARPGPSADLSGPGRPCRAPARPHPRRSREPGRDHLHRDRPDPPTRVHQETSPVPAPGRDPAAEEWGAVKALAVLAGDQCAGVDACIGYLTSKHDYLRYDQALAAGWLIATGVIEGACRHLTQPPRHHRSQMGLQGAKAILALRAVIANGDFGQYWHYHPAREHQRLYPGTAQDRYTLGT